VNQRESFIFESVLTNPVGDQVEQLTSYATLGYIAVLIYIRIESSDESIKRLAMRTCQGGHDVPDEKLYARFARTHAILQRAIQSLIHDIVYSNEDLSHPYQFVLQK
jgi:predicted ABC-type ATPase